MTVVHFKLIKSNGHVAYEDEMEETMLGSFLRGSGATRIQWMKDGVVCEIVNEHARI